MYVCLSSSEFLEFCLFCVCQGALWYFPMRIQNLNFCHTWCSAPSSLAIHPFWLCIHNSHALLASCRETVDFSVYYSPPELTNMFTISVFLVIQSSLYTSWVTCSTVTTLAASLSWWICGHLQWRSDEQAVPPPISRALPFLLSFPCL